MTPDEIEAKSFSIIDNEAGSITFSPLEWQIVRRMIHTSADFEYMKTVRFHPEAISRGIEAIVNGKIIVTDTNMVKTGINIKGLMPFGCKVTCLIQDSDVSKNAEASGKTRASLAVDAVLEEMEGGIYVIGNAPTALIRLMEVLKEGKAKPALIIGLPVGFVNAAESKAELVTMNYPFISNVGRKGGSTVAASVVNALLKLAKSSSVVV